MCQSGGGLKSELLSTTRNDYCPTQLLLLWLQWWCISKDRTNYSALFSSFYIELIMHGSFWREKIHMFVASSPYVRSSGR